MVNVNINKGKIHSMARVIKQQLDKRSFTNEKDKNAGFNLCLQIASQSLFSKPYEEVLATLLKNSSKPTSADLSRVIVLSYGIEHIITLDGEYVISSAPGTDMEISKEAILQQASSLAAINDSTVKKFAVPEIAGDEWECGDVISIARKMGVFTYPITIFEMFEDSNTEVFIGNCHILYKLNGDWEDESQALVQGDEDPYDQVVWFPEYITEDMTKIEWSVTLGNLCEAKPIEGDAGWWVELDGAVAEDETGIKVSFKS
tara:strand:- start:749 stop:1525 length:777 start_codon:yes stop_codon:yes gene_type:complete